MRQKATEGLRKDSILNKLQYKYLEREKRRHVNALCAEGKIVFLHFAVSALSVWIFRTFCCSCSSGVI